MYTKMPAPLNFPGAGPSAAAVRAAYGTCGTDAAPAAEKNAVCPGVLLHMFLLPDAFLPALTVLSGLYAACCRSFIAAETALYPVFAPGR